MQGFLDPKALIYAIPVVLFVVLILTQSGNNNGNDFVIPPTYGVSTMTPTIAPTETPFHLECIHNPYDRNEKILICTIV